MDVDVYLAKAEQCLAGAQVAVDHGHYNNAANRAYYAAFQAATAALAAAGVIPPTPRYWSHDFVLREYARRAVPRAVAFSPGSASALKALQDERLKADYETELLERRSGERALALARLFVDAVRQRLGEEDAWQSGPPHPTAKQPSPP
jgi:uncharacterized protein (UPF0332 family)